MSTYDDWKDEINSRPFKPEYVAPKIVGDGPLRVQRYNKIIEDNLRREGEVIRRRMARGEVA